MRKIGLILVMFLALCLTACGKGSGGGSDASSAASSSASTADAPSAPKGETVDAGDFTVFVPDGWLGIVQTNPFGAKDAQGNYPVRSDAYAIIKGGESEWDALSMPTVYIYLTQGDAQENVPDLGHGGIRDHAHHAALDDGVHRARDHAHHGVEEQHVLNAPGEHVGARRAEENLHQKEDIHFRHHAAEHRAGRGGGELPVHGIKNGDGSPPRRTDIP